MTSVAHKSQQTNTVRKNEPRQVAQAPHGGREVG